MGDAQMAFTWCCIQAGYLRRHSMTHTCQTWETEALTGKSPGTQDAERTELVSSLQTSESMVSYCRFSPHFPSASKSMQFSS